MLSKVGCDRILHPVQVRPIFTVACLSIGQKFTDMALAFLHNYTHFPKFNTV